MKRDGLAWVDWLGIIISICAFGALVGLFGCGGTSPKSQIEGNWNYEIVGVVCANGAQASGMMLVYDASGLLSGEYDVCDRTFAAADLRGHANGRAFDIEMFGGATNVINGIATGDALSGEVTGLGPGVTFKATRAGARQGKQPPDRP